MRKRIITITACLLLLAGVAGLGIYYGLRRGDTDSSAAANTPPPASTSLAAPTAAPSEPEYTFMIAPASLGDLSVTPLFSTERGVAVDTSFLIQSYVKTTRDELNDILFLHDGETDVPFELTANTSGEYLLTPEKPLAHNQVYTLHYQPAEKHPLSIAFQTERGFGVVSTLPAADRSYVPIDTGIEITFNEPLESGLQGYFTIRPAVDGRFEQVGDTYVFVPAGLAFDTRYTVTVKGGADGIRGESGRTLQEDYSFSFSTEWGTEGYTYFDVYGDVYETFLPDDDVFIELNASQDLTDCMYTVDVYRVPTSAHAFIDGDSDYMLNGGPSKDFELQETFETKLAVSTGSSYSRNQYFILTDRPFAPGYYLFDIKTEYNGKTFTARKWIQVSALSVYSLSLGGELCLWVNDTTNGNPVANATVMSEDGTQTVTDADGVALLSVSAQVGMCVYIEAEGHDRFVYRTQTYDPKTIEPNQRYYRYFYTDRRAYLPNDTISIFGAINARYPEYEINPNDAVTFRLGDMAEVRVTPDAYGVFQASIPVSGLHGGVTLSLCVNGDAIDNRYISFVKYNREKYVLNGQTDKNVYMSGETIALDFSVTTFDGAPVEDVKLDGEFDNKATPVTDAGGLASGTMKAAGYYGYNNWYDWRPGYTGLWYSLRNADDYIQSLSVPIVIIPAQIMLEHENTTDSSITFTASSIDREAVERLVTKSGGPSYYSYLDPDLYRGKPANLTFTLTVEKQTITRVKTGEHYDFVQKKNVPSYEYNYNTTVYDTYTARTENGRAVIDGLPVSRDPLVSYSGYVEYKDPTGETVKFFVNIGTNASFNEYNTARNYYYVLDRPEKPGETYNYRLRRNETGSVRLVANDLGENEIIKQGRIVTIVSRENILNTSVGKPEGTPVTFTQDCVYNISVFGAYFDGRYIYPVEYPLNIFYDYDEMNLTFDMTFDQSVYKPGATVNATVHVKDEQGNPVRTRLNVCVADEAVLRLNPNEPYFLSGYYGSVYVGAYPWSIYTSYTRHDGSGFGGAEKGEGGDDYDMRRDFNDNPVFDTYETNENGELKLSFTLADAVTTWRVTLHGITEKQQVGDTKFYINASLPYYMDMVMTDTFLTGDDVAVLVKSHGEQYRLKTTPVAYKAELCLGGAVVDTQLSDSTTYAQFNFGKRPAGEYTLRIYADAEGADGTIYRDAMEKPLLVTENDTPLTLTDRIIIDVNTPSINKSYDITASPVTVTFTNGDVKDMLSILLSCVNYGSDRTDYIAGTAYATALLQRNPYDPPVRLTVSDLPEDAQNMWSGVPEVTYGSSDVFYTARFAAAFPELMGKDSLRLYVKSNASLYEDPWSQTQSPVIPPSDDPEFEAKRAAGYLSLAAIRDNVLLEIYQQTDILQNNSDPSQYSDTYYGRLRVLLYAAALCAIGDDPSADALIKRYPASDAAFRHEDPAESERRRELLNALTLYIQTTLDPQAAFETLKGHMERNDYSSDICERINFIKKAVPLTGVASQIKYTLDGAVKDLTLVNFDCQTLTLTKEQYDALHITQVSGKTNVDVTFTGSPDNLNASYNTLKLDKEINPVDGYDNMYRVSLTLNLSPILAASNTWQYFTVYDRIPSNMRYTIPSSQPQPSRMWADTEGQYITLHLYTDGKSKIYKYEYYMLRVSDAEAELPKAYISQHFHLTDNSWGVTR